MNLGGLAPVLPSLHGTVLQVGGGGLKGNTWEFFIQELTDYMGQQQMDRCDGRGGWYYHELGNSNGSNDCGSAGHSDASSINGHISGWRALKSRDLHFEWLLPIVTNTESLPILLGTSKVMGALGIVVIQAQAT